MLRPIPFLKPSVRRMPVRIQVQQRPPTVRRKTGVGIRRPVLVGFLSLAVVFSIIGAVLALVGVLALCGIVFLLLDSDGEGR